MGTDQERFAGAAISGTRPLAGVTVVSLEQAIPAPFCTRQLADPGARVIKVERPGKGDFARDYDQRVNGLCSHFVWVNRSKESLALDPKNTEDLAMLKQLLGRVDVLIQNLAPGATDRLGLSYEALSEANPKLIVCDISSYRSDGPYRNKKAYDLLIQSEAGFLSITGTKGQPAKSRQLHSRYRSWHVRVQQHHGCSDTEFVLAILLSQLNDKRATGLDVLWY